MICASSWTITRYHCMMHGQQNVKFSLSVEHAMRRQILRY